MFLLDILGGWLVLSCVAAPFIGRFIGAHATIADDTPTVIEPQLQPVSSF